LRLDVLTMLGFHLMRVITSKLACRASIIKLV